MGGKTVNYIKGLPGVRAGSGGSNVGGNKN